MKQNTDRYKGTKGESRSVKFLYDVVGVVDQYFSRGSFHIVLELRSWDVETSLFLHEAEEELEIAHQEIFPVQFVKGQAVHYANGLF